MLGPYPTWYTIRERGRSYIIALRWSWYPIQGPLDPQEELYLMSAHRKIGPILNMAQEGQQLYEGFWWDIYGPDRAPLFPGAPIRRGVLLSRQHYMPYRIPFGWRKPFEEYLKELFGPPGDRPVGPASRPV